MVQSDAWDRFFSIPPSFLICIGITSFIVFPQYAYYWKRQQIGVIFVPLFIYNSPSRIEL